MVVLLQIFFSRFPTEQKSLTGSASSRRTTVKHSRSRNFYNNRGGDRYGSRRGGYGGRDDRGSFNDRNRPKYGPALKTKYGLNVENVSSRTGWQDFKHLFRPVVEVANAEAHQDVKKFDSQEDFNKAMDELD